MDVRQPGTSENYAILCASKVVFLVGAIVGFKGVKPPFEQNAEFLFHGISGERSSNLAYLVILTTLLTLAPRISSRTVEPAELNSIQIPMIMAHNFPNMMKSTRDSSNDSADKLCQIEYQVTRKRKGNCVKIGHGLVGCVAEEYINPFHPDCF